ncbi:MAG: tetratricopeptide repeat protein [Phycisphaeraceae bacterium]
MTTPPTKRPPDPIPEEEETDLQSFLRNARAWFDQYGTNVLVVVLAIVLGFVGWNWYSGREARALETAYTELAMAETPRGKQDVAQRYEHVPGLAGKAYLEAGNMLLNEAMGLPPEFGVEPRELTDEERQANFEQAAELYQRVIDRQHSTLQVINARFGLAAVHENLGNWDEAAEQYDLAAEDAADFMPAVATKAIDLKAGLDRIANPVMFPQAPEPDEAAAEDDGGFRLDLNDLQGGEEGLQDLPLELPETEQPAEDVPVEPIDPETEDDAEDAELDVQLP